MKTQVTKSNELIDYDAEFRTYLEKWYEENKQHFEKPEEVEQLLPELTIVVHFLIIHISSCL